MDRLLIASCALAFIHCNQAPNAGVNATLTFAPTPDVGPLLLVPADADIPFNNGPLRQGCPVDLPLEGATCGDLDPSTSVVPCEYESRCGTVQSAVCMSSGWEVSSDECEVCPNQNPGTGSSCTTVSNACVYFVDSTQTWCTQTCVCEIDPLTNAAEFSCNNDACSPLICGDNHDACSPTMQCMFCPNTTNDPLYDDAGRFLCDDAVTCTCVDGTFQCH